MSEKPVLINSHGERIDVEELIERCRLTRIASLPMTKWASLSTQVIWMSLL